MRALRIVGVTSLLACLFTAATAALDGPMASLAVGSVWTLAVTAGALRWVALDRRGLKLRADADEAERQRAEVGGRA